MKNFRSTPLAAVLTSLAVPALFSSAAFAQSQLDGRRIVPASLPVSKINATGTASSTTYLRGDGAWQAPAAVSDHKIILSSGDTSPDVLDTKLGVSGILTIGDSGGVRIIGMGAAAAGVSGYLLGSDFNTFSGKEPSLGLPSTSGYVLSSTAAGVRSWIAPQSGPAGPAGATGAAGTNGTNGAAASVSVGTTTTGAAGSAASVTNSGTSNAALLNFTIPAGPAGTGGSGGGVNVVSTLPAPSSSTDNNYYLLRQAGLKDSLFLGAHSAAGTSRLAQISLAFYLNKAPLSAVSASVVADWRCEDGYGNTLSDQKSTTALTTTAAGIWGSDTNGNYYNPSGSQYASAASTALSGTSDFSLEFCINDPQDGTQRYLFAAGAASGTNEPFDFLKLPTSRWYWRIYNSGGTSFAAQESATGPSGRNHFVVTYRASDGRMQLWHNGSVTATATATGTRLAAASFGLGTTWSGSFGAGTEWSGGVYFARVYNADISTSVAAMYANL